MAQKLVGVISTSGPKGKDGKDGNSIVGAYINSDGHLIIQIQKDDESEANNG